MFLSLVFFFWEYWVNIYKEPLGTVTLAGYVKKLNDKRGRERGHKDFLFYDCIHFSLMIQGPTKVSCGRPEQVGFPVGQVTFHSQLPDGQAPKKSSANKLTKK